MPMDYDNNRTFQQNMQQRLRRGRESFSEFRAEAQATARRAARRTNNYVHDHPWQVLAGTGVMCFAIGALMARRPRPGVIIKQPRPIVKKQVVGKKHGLDLVHGLIPLALTIAKLVQASRKGHAQSYTRAASDGASQPVP